MKERESGPETSAGACRNVVTRCAPLHIHTHTHTLTNTLTHTHTGSGKFFCPTGGHAVYKNKSPKSDFVVCYLVSCIFFMQALCCDNLRCRHYAANLCEVLLICKAEVW